VRRLARRGATADGGADHAGLRLPSRACETVAMGRVRAGLAGIILALVAASVPAPAAAVAQPTPSPTPDGEPEIFVPDAVPGEEMCAITDERLQTLSGIVALDESTYAVVNSHQESWQLWPIFLLNDQCQVVQEIPFPSRTLRPEALAYDREREILWVGDTGVPSEGRQTVALWRVDLAGDRVPVIHRFSYPGEMRDAEALLLDGDGTPIIVTRDPSGTTELFLPAQEMVPLNAPEQAVPLEQVGEFTVPDTGTDYSGQLPSAVARSVVTDGANSPEGDRVVLRTYTDAFEWDVTDGDVAAAITGGTPRVTPLPDEPLGEAITYSADGQFFVTVSEVVQESGEQPVMTRYTPSDPPPEPTPDTTAPAGAAAGGTRSLLDRLGPQGILNLIGAVGVVGLLMVIAGVIGIVRARRSAEDDEYDDEEEDEEYGEEYGASPVAARAQVTPPPPHPGGQYGPPPPPPPPPSAAPPPPGAEQVGGQRSGTVYGSGAGYQGPGYGQPYDEPFDQDYPHDYQGQGYHGQGHPPPPERGGTYSGGTYSGGTYSGGTYQSGQGVPDYYSDDPDYSYEFRDRDDW
jgi:hypothetical protein